MSVRRMTAVGAALLVLSGGAAHAATRPRPKPPIFCKIVQDATGDPLSTDATLDVTSADIVSNGKLVTAVIRLAKFDPNDPMTAAGKYYDITWAVDSVGFALKAHITPAGNAFYAVTSPATGFVDAKKGEIHITAKVDDFPGHPTWRAGSLMTNLIVRADVTTPAYPLPMTFLVAGDDAKGTKAYPVGAASCIKLGA